MTWLAELVVNQMSSHVVASTTWLGQSAVSTTTATGTTGTTGTTGWIGWIG
jgi:hypothetical protein